MTITAPEVLDDSRSGLFSGMTWEGLMEMVMKMIQDKMVAAIVWRSLS